MAGYPFHLTTACGGLFWEPEAPEPPAELPTQVETCYQYLKQGKSELECRLLLQRQYSTAARPLQAYKKALALLVAEERNTLDTLPERVSAAKWHCVAGAIQDRQWGAAAALLKSLLPEMPPQLSEAGAELLIRIEEAQEEA